MKIKNTSEINHYAWGAQAGFFPAGATREVPEKRQAQVTAELVKGGRLEVVGFKLVDESEETTRGPGLDLMNSDDAPTPGKKSKPLKPPKLPVE